jgi:hypothetical protein
MCSRFFYNRLSKVCCHNIGLLMGGCRVPCTGTPQFTGKFCAEGKLFATEGVVLAFVKKVGRPVPVGVFPPYCHRNEGRSAYPSYHRSECRSPQLTCSCACATSGEMVLLGETVF